MRSTEARIQLQNTIQRTIRSFLASTAPHLILDTRSRSAYRARHLAPSTNIPQDKLHRSWFQLPPKQTPFAVLQSAREPTCTGSKDAGRTVSFKQDHSCPNDTGPSQQDHFQPNDLLRSRGWKPDWTFEDHPIFWSTLAHELSLTTRDHLSRQGQGQGQGQGQVQGRGQGEGQGQGQGQAQGSVKPPQLSIETAGRLSRSTHPSRYNFLFKPNPVLVKMLPSIEHRLLQQRQPSNQTLTSTLDSEKPPSDLTPSPTTVLRCLDMGCGSGRDMTYMVARAANNKDPSSYSFGKAQWTVLGMDQRKDACERALQLAKDTFPSLQQQDRDHSLDLNLDLDLDLDQELDLASRVSTLVGKVDPTTGVFWVSPSQPSSFSSSSSSSSPLLRLNNIRYQDPDQDQLQLQQLRIKNARSCKNDNSHPGGDDDDDADRFDLILMIRFLQRPLLEPLVQHWLRPGGFVLLSTFVSDVDLPHYSKPGPAHRLQSKTEARDIFERLGLEIVLDEVSLIEDGTRSVATVVAQLPLK